MAFAALAFVYAVQAWESAARDVRLVYQAPAGELRTTLIDGGGQRVRTTIFSRGDRAHQVRLPEGRYRVQLEVGGEVRTREVSVDDRPTIEVRW